MDPTDIPAFIRPIQTSSFANLPVEILFEIEKKLKQSFENAFERQAERMSFSSLCFRSRISSSGWKEVAVYDERMGELADLVEEIGAGGAIKSITITDYGFPSKSEQCELIPPSVEFGQLMKLCKAVTELNSIDSILTRQEAASLGVGEMFKNDIKLTRLSLKHSSELVAEGCFFPLFHVDYPANLTLEDLAYRDLQPLCSIPTRFTSLELIDTETLFITPLELFLAPSIGFIKQFTFDNVYIGSHQEMEDFKKLFKGLGSTLTHMGIGAIDGTYRSRGALKAVLPSLQILEELILKDDNNIDPSIFEVFSKISQLKKLSIPFCDAIIPQDSDWPLLEFIKKPPPTLRTLEITFLDYPASLSISKMKARLEELVDTAKESRVTLKFKTS